MKLVSDIINELMDYNAPISGALLKTKVLASRISHPELSAWVEEELGGYKEHSIVPDYRQTSGIPTGNYMNGNLQYSKAQIPIGHLNEEENTILTEITIRESISSVEGMIGKKGLKFSVSSQRTNYLENTIRMLGNPYFQILSVYLDLPASFLTSILSGVRTKLLDFMLEVENQFGTETEIEDLKSKKAIISQIMHTTINSNGDGVVITAGSNNEVTANVNIYKDSKTHLEKVLLENGVEPSDIQGLLELIDKNPATTIDRYSAKVNEWIIMMINKAAKGSWQVGIGAAGTLLGDAIARYYGLK